MSIHLEKRRWLRWYFRYFDFIAEKRLQRADTDTREIHAHTAMVLSTAVLMWAHVILACASLASPLVVTIGIVCSTIHLLSPLLFRITNRVFLISNLAIAAGFIFQLSFSLYSGGYLSSTLKWIAILPLCSGIVVGARGVILWALLSTIAHTFFMTTFVAGIEFPNYLTRTGIIWANSLLLYGWIFLTSVMMLFFVAMKDNTEKLLQEQSKKIDDLFRVLFHDLANSLGRINIGISIARKQNANPSLLRGVEIASQAADSMMEITQNVRKMYAVSKGKAEVDLAPTSLNDSVEYLQKVFASDLEKKDLRISYDFDKNRGLHLLVEPVSFKNQVLGNIISNAIKFSHAGNKIDITCYPLNHHYHAVEIRDHGIGMPPTLIEQMFDLSKKTSRQGTGGEMGTGFGMHIMKSFVEMYNGQVMIESLEAKEDANKAGTTFKLILKGEWS